MLIESLDYVIHDSLKGGKYLGIPAFYFKCLTCHLDFKSRSYWYIKEILSMMRD